MWQDLVGAACMVPVLFAFEPWRLQFFGHILSVNQLGEDTGAWHPVTVEDVAYMVRNQDNNLPAFVVVAPCQLS